MTTKPPSPQERLAAATEALVDLGRQTLAERRRDAEDRREEERQREKNRPGSRRPDLFKIPFQTYMQAAPQLAQAFSRTIPPEFWALDSDDAAVISCPCGATPTAKQGVAEWCGASDWVEEDRERDPERDGCGRAYLFDGENVRVAFSPVATAA